jgi:hypothetical protein
MKKGANMKRAFILFFIIISLSLSQDMIVRVYAPTWDDLKRISPKYLLDIASVRAGEWYDIVADREVFNKIVASGLTYEVIVHSLAQQKNAVRADYLSYTETNDSLRQFVQNYPLICKLDSLPIPTHEGNWLYGVKISDNVHIEEDDEPGFLVDGLHHSREWACIPTVMFFADSMLTSYGVVPEITDIINTTEIYCFPIINADGYLHDYPTGLSWRKNREPFGGAIGTDPNRNYPGCAPYLEGDWGAVDKGGASHYPSDITFCGAYANSGDETRALALYARSHVCNAYMSFHSYGQMTMWGWGWTTQHGTPDDVLHIQVGTHIAGLVRKLGSGYYDAGQIPIILYAVSGSSIDWFYSWCHYVGGFSNLSYTTELGTTFYQPVGDLDHIIHENFKALEYLAHYADSIVLLCEGVVAAPVIYPLGLVNENFTVSWHAVNSDDNHPTRWELVELSNPSVIEDDLEAGASRWVFEGFRRSSTRPHSGLYSLYSGSDNNVNRSARTLHPYLVQPGDSVTFWCWYSLEANYDVAVVEVSENTKEWLNLDTTRFTAGSGMWLRKAYSLENWVGKSVYLRFRAMTDGSGLGMGFWVDDIFPVCLFANVDTISSGITDTTYQFTNHPEGEYYYYVRGYNTTWLWGYYSCLEKANVVVGVTESNTPESVFEPPNFSLSPNPFKYMTDIRYQIGENRNARIEIFDASGRLIKSFNNLTNDESLVNHVVWYGRDDSEKMLPAGVYFVRFKTGDYERVEKALLLR